jgi:GNAT superfamily N-acetyltransferase
MSTDEPLPFPLGQGSVTVTTRRGRDVHIRHITAEDAALLIDLFNQLSLETRRLRFFAPKPDVPDEVLWPQAVRLSNINPLVEAALIGTVPEATPERAVGVARLVRDADDAATAEVAIVVRDDYQSEGLGTVLFDLLIQVAMVRDLKRLRAVSLAENEAIQRLVRNTGLPVTSRTLRGETTMIILLAD